MYSNTPLPSILGSISSNTILNYNQWHHIAGTYDGTTMKMYIDGVLENAIESNIQYIINNVPLMIGLFPYGYNDGHGNEPNILNGMMDEVMVFNRALSETEIKTLYNSL